MRPNGYDQHGSPLQSATPQTHTGPLDMATAQTGTIGKQPTGLLPRTGTRQGEVLQCYSATPAQPQLRPLSCGRDPLIEVELTNVGIPTTASTFPNSTPAMRPSGGDGDDVRGLKSSCKEIYIRKRQPNSWISDSTWKLVDHQAELRRSDLLTQREGRML